MVKCEWRRNATVLDAFRTSDSNNLSAMNHSGLMPFLEEPIGGRVADRLEELRALKLLAPLVKDLHRPQPIVYWSDLAACLALTALGLYLSTPFPDTVLHG